MNSIPRSFFLLLIVLVIGCNNEQSAPSSPDSEEITIQASETPWETPAELAILAALRDNEPKAALKGVANELARSGLGEEAWKILQQQFQNDHFAFQNVGIELAENGEKTFALQTLKHSVTLIQNDEGEFTYEYLLPDIAAAFADAGDLEEAKATLNLTLKMAQAASERNGEEIQMSTVSTVAAKWARIGELDHALEMVQNLEKGNDQVFMLVQIGSGFVEVGDKSQAKKVFLQAVEVAKTIPDDEERIARFTRLSKCLFDADALEEAESLLKQYVHPAIFVEGIREIALKQYEMGHLDQARETLRRAADVANELQADVHKQSYIKEILIEMGRIGDVEFAKDLAEKHKDLIGPSGELLVVRGIARTGNADAVIEFANRAVPADVVPKAIAFGATELLAVGNKDRALELYKQAHRLVNNKSKSDNIRYRVIKLVAFHASEAGDFQLAMDAARELPPSIEQDAAYHSIALEHAKAADAETAIEVALLTNQADRRRDTLHRVMVTLAELGKSKLALENILQLKPYQDRDFLLNELFWYLPTEPLPDLSERRRIKKSFSSEEKQVAKQLVEALQAK